MLDFPIVQGRGFRNVEEDGRVTTGPASIMSTETSGSCSSS